LGEELELRVEERTSELAAANRQLLAQIDERERVEATLRQMQRLEAVGQLTSGVAHDFNNLLTVVLRNISFVEKGLKGVEVEPKLLERLNYMRLAAERGAKLTDQLLAFSRKQRLEPKVLDINGTVAAMRDLLQSTLGGSVRIETKLGEGVWPAMVDSTQLELAILNLAINARDAMQIGGSLSVATANVTLGPPLNPEEPSAGEYIAVTVTDTGTGMPPAVRAKCFEPFFTTKDVGKGSGLGLSQVLGFAKQSGGGLRLQSRIGEGTCVHVLLPRADANSSSRPAGAPMPALNEVHGIILLVDDDTAVREITASILRDQGHTVLEACSGAGALDLLQREPGVELMLIDFAMPSMSGVELARRVQAKQPTLPVLFITGFADRAALSGVPEGCVIGKPFVDAELTDKVRFALAGGVEGKVVRLRR
jgi:signal transduction histidine kinase/CheY-like chemotaxis protein